MLFIFMLLFSGCHNFLSHHHYFVVYCDKRLFQLSDKLFVTDKNTNLLHYTHKIMLRKYVVHAEGCCLRNKQFSVYIFPEYTY